MFLKLNYLTFLLWSFMSFIYILDITHLSVYSLYIFLPFYRLFLHCWLLPLFHRNFVIWCNPNYLYLLLFPMLLGFYPKDQCPSLCWEGITLCFSDSFIGYFLTFKYLTHFWVDFYQWWEMGVFFHSSACRYPIFTAPFLEKSVL
jgi:hypothetical protein